MPGFLSKLLRVLRERRGTDMSFMCLLSLAKMSSAPKQTDSPSRTAEDETRELNQEC